MKVCDLVIIKNEGISSLQWKLARVIKTHPLPDKNVCVVTLKTETSELKLLLRYLNHVQNNFLKVREKV